jgi:hypothetical protein
VFHHGGGSQIYRGHPVKELGGQLALGRFFKKIADSSLMAACLFEDQQLMIISGSSCHRNVLDLAITIIPKQVSF